jgi:hypothetical protein
VVAEWAVVAPKNVRIMADQDAKCLHACGPLD